MHLHSLQATIDHRQPERILQHGKQALSYHSIQKNVYSATVPDLENEYSNINKSDILVAYSISKLQNSKRLKVPNDFMQQNISKKIIVKTIIIRLPYIRNSLYESNSYDLYNGRKENTPHLIITITCTVRVQYVFGKTPSVIMHYSFIHSQWCLHLFYALKPSSYLLYQCVDHMV